MTNAASELVARQAATHALLRTAGILPVVTAATVEQALQTAAALARGGLSAMELTLRTAAALEALRALRGEGSPLRLGAGTLRSPRQVEEAIEHGADFLVTPGTTPALARELAQARVPVLPGAATPTEMMALLDLGFDVLKFFPAVPAGGLALIRSLAAPFPDLYLCPTGGIQEADAPEFLRQPKVLCVGGSWLVAPAWIAAGQFDRIEEAARRAQRLVAAIRAGTG